MTETWLFANPLTAAGRSKMRESRKVARAAMRRYPGADTSNRLVVMLMIVAFAGLGPKGDFRLLVLFGLVAALALMPLNIALSNLLAAAAHVRFGVARNVALAAATLVAGAVIAGLQTPSLDPDIARIATAAVLASFSWTEALLAMSYLRQGRATPAPEPGEYDHLLKGSLTPAMWGWITALFVVCALLLTLWIAL